MERFSRARFDALAPDQRPEFCAQLASHLSEQLRGRAFHNAVYTLVAELKLVGHDLGAKTKTTSSRCEGRITRFLERPVVWSSRSPCPTQSTLNRSHTSTNTSYILSLENFQPAGRRLGSLLGLHRSQAVIRLAAGKLRSHFTARSASPTRLRSAAR